MDLFANFQGDPNGNMSYEQARAFAQQMIDADPTWSGNGTFKNVNGRAEPTASWLERNGWVFPAAAGLGIGAAALAGVGAGAGGAGAAASGGAAGTTAGVAMPTAVSGLTTLPGVATGIPGAVGGAGAAGAGTAGVGGAVAKAAGAATGGGMGGDMKKLLTMLGIQGGVDLLGSLFAPKPNSFAGGPADPEKVLTEQFAAIKRLTDGLGKQMSGGYSAGPGLRAPAPISLPNVPFQIGGGMSNDPAMRNMTRPGLDISGILGGSIGSEGTTGARPRTASTLRKPTEGGQ